MNNMEFDVFGWFGDKSTHDSFNCYHAWLCEKDWCFKYYDNYYIDKECQDVCLYDVYLSIILHDMRTNE